MSSDLQNKLFHFEANPPGGVWNKIADALDADTELEFPQRLFNYQEQPPVQLWKNIEASLEEPETAIKVIPITRYKKPLRYVAAAASIIAIIFLATTFTNKKTGAGAVIGGTETVTTNQSSILPSNEPRIADNSNKNSTPLSSTADEEQERNQQRKRALASIRPQNIFRSFAFSQRLFPKKADKEELFDFSDLNSYMVYSDGDGNAMRLPKKLFNLVHCKDGDNSCRERIRELQQKMAAGATTTDFGGILEILRQLQ